MRLFMKSAFSAALFSSVFFASSAFADITIGFIGPVTGPVAAYGIQASNGTRVAVDEINKKGGVNGEKLVLKIFDDAAEPKQAISVANQIAGEGILYVVGPITSNSAMPVSNILQNNDILMITPSSTTSELSARNMWNVFRTIGRDDQQADYAAQYALAHWQGKKIAIIHDKATYGKGLADSFKKVLNHGGMKEAYYGSITPGERDYNVIVSRLKADKIDYIYFGGYHPEAGLLLRQMREQGVKAVMVGGDGLNTSELIAIAGNAANGTMYTSSFDSSKDPVAQDGFAALKAKNIPAETFAINGYAAVQAIAFGIEKAGGADDAHAVADVLHSGVKIPTISGEITYGERGDMTSKTFSLYKWENGKRLPIE